MKIERVVLGMDFGAPAVAAARWVAQAFAGAKEVILVNVVDVPHPPSFLSGILPPREELIETAKVGARDRLGDLVEELPALPGGHITTRIESGRPAERIAAVAEEVSADLVVVGEHGQRPGVWNALGSTAERLLHSSPVPVLLARSPSRKETERMLIALDESPMTAQILEWAAALGRERAEMILLHVLDPAVVGRVRLVSADRGAMKFEEQLRGGTRSWLLEQAGSVGLPEERVEISVALGRPGHEIIAAAERHDVDLIVMGSRGSRPIGQRALGSVARSVLRGATCSVLVVADG
ncbi:MAG: universal stress protein [Gemmatimonadota bacterium]